MTQMHSSVSYNENEYSVTVGFDPVTYKSVNVCLIYQANFAVYFKVHHKSVSSIDATRATSPSTSSSQKFSNIDGEMKFRVRYCPVH